MILKLAAIWEMPGEPIMPRVTDFHEITLEDVPGGQTLLDLSIRHRIPQLHQCDGYGRCTTCRVQILDGLFQCLAARRARTEGSIPRMAVRIRIMKMSATAASCFANTRC
jgi:ferredoxin